MKLLLIDGHSLAYRAFYALPPLSTSSGAPTQAVLGVVNMVFKILEDEKPSHMMVFFDRAVPSFRLDLYPEYKANREKPPDDFQTQLPLIERFFEILGVPVVREYGYEADDWIAAVTSQAESQADQIIILSADLDLLQLVSSKTSVLASQKGTSQFIRYTPLEMEKKFAVSPVKWTALKALIGDSSDNIKGVPGIGIKTATSLLQKTERLEDLFLDPESLPVRWKEKLQSYKGLILRNKDLVTLRTDAPLRFEPENCVISSFPQEQLNFFFQELEFKKLAAKFSPQERGVGSSLSDFSSVSNPALEFEFVDNQEKLERMLTLFQQSEEASCFFYPFPDPFLTEHYLAVEIPAKGRYVVNSPLSIGTLRQLAGVSGGKKIFTYNWKAFELAFLQEKLRSPDWRVHDLLLTGWLVNPLQADPSISALAAQFLSKTIPVKWAGKFPEKQEEVEILPFAAYQVSLMRELALELETKLQVYFLESLYQTVELPLSRVLAEMELNGIYLDQPYLQTLSEEMKKFLSECEAQIYLEAGQFFNLNSSKQLSEILYSKFKLPKGRKIKTGYSTDGDELERLSRDHRIARLLLQYREVSKLQNTYVDVFPKLISPSTGRLHTTYVQTGAATGRLSSRDPNLQNIPVRGTFGKKLRKAIAAEKPGWKILSADYSQIELRLIAHFSKDPVLIEAFEKNEDIHTRTACEIFDASPEFVTPEMRRHAKSVNFGILYGMTEYGLSQSLGIAREEAKEYIRRYFERFQGVEAYLKSSLESARELGLTRTLLGRIRHLPELQSKNQMVRQQAERMAVNAPLQGSAADLIKLAMLRIAEKLPEEQGMLTLQVHDELVFEVKESFESQTAALIKKEMEQAVKLDVPLTVDMVSGRNWNDVELLVERDSED